MLTTLLRVEGDYQATTELAHALVKTGLDRTADELDEEFRTDEGDCTRDSNKSVNFLAKSVKSMRLDTEVCIDKLRSVLY